MLLSFPFLGFDVQCLYCRSVTKYIPTSILMPSLHHGLFRIVFLDFPHRVFQVFLLSLIADLIALRSENVFSFLKLLYLLRLVFTPVCHQILKTLPFMLEKNVWSEVSGCWVELSVDLCVLAGLLKSAVSPAVSPPTFWCARSVSYKRGVWAPSTAPGLSSLPLGGLAGFSSWIGAAYMLRTLTASWWNERFALWRVFSNSFF